MTSRARVAVCAFLIALSGLVVWLTTSDKKSGGNGAFIRRAAAPGPPRPHSGLSLSNQFPTYEETLEAASLSRLVYKLYEKESCEDAAELFPVDLECVYYHHDPDQGTQVLLAVSPQFIVTAFAGTDDLRTSLADGDIMLKPFGPVDNATGESILLPGKARVHAGFDNAVFSNGLYDHLTKLLGKVRQQYPDRRMLATGHSLGASDSVLLSVAWALRFPELEIKCVNFGCPRTGNYAWRHTIHDNLPNLGIWRFVLGWDLVPRLPEFPFYHVGHTLQLRTTEERASAYYLHHGNTTLGWAGVPIGWSETPFIWVPGALGSHRMLKYYEYIENHTSVIPDSFVSIYSPTKAPNGKDDDDAMPFLDDDVIPPPSLSEERER